VEKGGGGKESRRVKALSSSLLGVKLAVRWFWKKGGKKRGEKKNPSFADLDLKCHSLSFPVRKKKRKKKGGF